LNDIDVSTAGVEAPPWIPACREFISAVLEARGIGDWEVSLLLCDDRFIQDLNLRYRGIEAPTDVLSFPQATPETPSPPRRRGQNSVAGDIVVSLDALKRQALQNRQPEEAELKRLLIHGILHLQGLDHPPAGGPAMIGIQEEILVRLKDVRIF
jgi:probable rRNA maturation factor